MSVAVGMHLGRYVLMGTDMRLCRFITFDQPVAARDDLQKLMMNPLGLMTAVGNVDLGLAVLARLSSVRQVGDVLDIIAEERAAVAANELIPEEIKTRALATTAWMFTFQAPGHLRLAIYHNAWGHNLASIPPGDIRIFLPDVPAEHHLKASAWAALTELVPPGAIRICDTGEDLESSAVHHVTLMRSILREASRRLPISIGGQALIGVHGEDGVKQIASGGPIAE